ncbi:MAG: hypothetical protein LBB14_01845 [Puniceicoccales bacterium]|jgi:uncharacterized alkaline shock family protein YloU|nr:hypothetical protein [Puniceicoccales bacterium]
MGNDIANFLRTACGAYPAAFWGTVALLALFLLWIFRCRRRASAHLCLDSGELGTVSVAPSALQEVVRAVCRDVVPNGRAWVRVRRRRGQLHVRVTLRMPMGRNVCACAKMIQKSAADCLRSQFGIERAYAIDMHVGGFRGPFVSVENPEGPPPAPAGAACGAGGEPAGLAEGTDPSAGAEREET